MIGILLAGGQGSRLFPLTNTITKHLLPIYDKPVIYYSLSILMLAGIRHVIIIGKKEDIKNYKKIFKINKNFGLKINFLQQNKSEGIAHSLILSKNLIKKNNFCLLLGDNFFYGDGLIKIFSKAKKILQKKKSVIFSHSVKNPEQYGVVKFSSNKILEIIEKPINFISNQIVVGIYFYNNETLRYVSSLKKSSRGEYEITDFNNKIIKDKKMKIIKLGRGITWYDVGSFNDLLNVSNFINSIQERHEVLIGSPEEIAFKKGWLKKKMILKIKNNKINNSYVSYLKKIL